MLFLRLEPTLRAEQGTCADAPHVDLQLRNSEDGQVSGRTSGGSDAGGVSSSNGGSGDGGGSGGSSGGGSGRAFDSLLIFCNNVAFNQGTIHRCGSGKLNPKPSTSACHAPEECRHETGAVPRICWGLGQLAVVSPCIHMDEAAEACAVCLGH